MPGEENLDLLESLRSSSIRLIVCRHEQAAGFIAATYGRLTGSTGVCLATLGPGATNLVTAAAYAQLGAMPMLMITGQKPIKTSKQGEFQILDTVDMMQPLTKYTRQLSSANYIPARVREAFRRAAEERPGAVHLELPEDIAREETESQVIRRSRYDNPRSSETSLQQAREMIEAARHPLLLVGAGANRRHTCKALRAFVDRTGIPFFTTQMGKGVLDERHPLYLGTAALSGEDYLHRAIEHADLIINVGHDVVEKPPFIMDGDSPEGDEPSPDIYAVTYGASAKMTQQFTEETYARQERSEAGFSVRGGVKVFGSGGSGHHSELAGQQTGTRGTLGSEGATFVAVGGNGSWDQGGYSAGGTPYPILLDLRPIYELLNPMNFPGEPEVYQRVRANLQRAVVAYLEANTTPISTVSMLPEVAPLPSPEPARPRRVRTKVFTDPDVGGRWLDLCWKHGTCRTQQALNAYCRMKGYPGGGSKHRHENMGLGQVSSRIGDGSLCTSTGFGNCRRITRVTCSD